MNKILLASHGYLAQGMKSSLEILMGTNDRIECLCAYIDDDTRDVSALIDAWMESKDPADSWFVVTAIFGVNLRFFKPFIAGCIGGGCGALVCALTSLAASGTGVTGIFCILLCLAQPVQYAIMFAVAALVSFAVSFVLYKDEPKASEQA